MARELERTSIMYFKAIDLQTLEQTIFLSLNYDEVRTKPSHCHLEVLQFKNKELHNHKL